MMTMDMYDTICVVAKYVGNENHMYAEVVDVFTITLTLSQRDGRKSRNNGAQSIFKKKCVELDQTQPNWQPNKMIILYW